MRILLTGAAGFIGSHLTERFLASAHSVIAVDNLSTGRVANLASFRDHSAFTFIEQDVIEAIEIDGELDWVMHFASPASPPKYLQLPLQTLRVNSEGTYQLLELAGRKRARFFMASTSEIYGDPLEHPQPEAYWGNVNTVGPRSIYDEGKRYAETITMAYHCAHQLSVRIIRIFNTYGPRMDPQDGRVVTNFIMQALKQEECTIYGDGSQTRSFQYVDDLVDGICKLMEVEYCGPVNLGNPEEFTMLELACLVKELTGSHAPIVHRLLPQDDPKQRRPDISKAQNVLGWNPTVSVRDGLMRTIEHFRRDL
jgi:nucleoside-diphosphate-sugar epimerase